jgi:excisionase family DNA binding protein
LPTPNPRSDLLTIREAAEILRLSPESVRRRVRAGTIPACKLSQRAVRIRRADLDAIIEPAPDADSIEAHIAKIVASFPPLTPEQCARIASIMQAGGAA